MKIALVAMPWSFYRVASPALGALAAYLRAHTTHEVECFYEYLNVFLELEALYEPISRSERLGELVYAAQMFPGSRDAFRDAFPDWVADHKTQLTWIKEGAFPWPEGALSEQADIVLRVADAHIADLAQRLTQGYDMCAFTTTYGQLFASLAASQRLKTIAPEVKVVLGGWAVAGETGRSIVETFPFVDYVVQGDGEKRLVALADALEKPDIPLPSIDGVVSRIPTDEAVPEAAALDVEDLDSLPLPAFETYNDLVDRHSELKWSIPIEASRAAARTGRRRLKSPARLASEMEAQADRYQNIRFLFIDDVGAPTQGAALGDALDRHDKTYGYFRVMRPNTSPYDLLRMWESGCCHVDMGIEGLSATYLRRLSAPYTVIECLQAMRTCYELGINHTSRIVVEHPGTTPEEVRETIETVRRFGIAYQPLQPRRFAVGSRGAVATGREGVSAFVNARSFMALLPPAIGESLRLPWVDATHEEPATDWGALAEVIEKWRALHRYLLTFDGVGWFLGTRPLYYYDGGTFLKVFDRRDGHLEYVLDPLSRELYFYCMEIRQRSEVYEWLKGQGTPRDVDEIIEDLVRAALMFREGDQVLSLAVAYRGDIAVRRMRRYASESAGTRGQELGVESARNGARRAER